MIFLEKKIHLGAFFFCLQIIELQKPGPIGLFFFFIHVPLPSFHDLIADNEALQSDQPEPEAPVNALGVKSDFCFPHSCVFICLTCSADNEVVERGQRTITRED